MLLGGEKEPPAGANAEQWMETLRQQQGRYEALCRAVTDYVFSVRIENNRPVETKHSQACELVTGYTAEEFAADPYLWIRMVPAEDRALVQTQAESVLAGYEPEAIEHRIVRKDGVTRWVRNTPVLHHDAEGRLSAYDGLIRDVTDRRNAEEALRHSEALLRNALMAAPALVTLQDRDHNILLSNWRGYEYARPADPTTRVKCYEAIMNRDHPCETCMANEVFLTGRSKRAERADPAKGMVYEIHVYPILDDAGNVSMIAEHILDITARRYSQQERVRLAAAVEQVTESIVITDVGGRVLYVNPAFERVSGYTRKELLGRDYAGVTADLEHISECRRIHEAAMQGQVSQTRHHCRTKDERLIDVETTVSPVYDPSGTIVSVVHVSRDVTREVELERQLRQAQKLEAIGTLASGIAHDFNNILSGVLGYTELAMQALPEDSHVYRELSAAVSAARRAADLVKQILMFSRHSEQQRRPVQIQAIVKEAMKLLRGSLPATIEIRQIVDRACGPVQADPTQVHQIIMNLCTNAFHAMRDRGGVLTVEVAEVDPPQDRPGEGPTGRCVQLTVSDTGHGMSSEVLERIFEPYFTTKKLGEGTGLGLSTVHGIVKSHGGDVSVESEAGIGSTFRVRLPLCPEETPKPEPRPMDLDTLKGTERILVVDDELAILGVLETLLTRLGYEVTPLTSSRKAADLFQAAPSYFDMVITDQTMPTMTGTELAAELLAIRESVPIVLCTGFSEAVNEESALAMGIRAFVSKPIVIREFAGQIRQILDHQALAKKQPEDAPTCS